MLHILKDQKQQQYFIYCCGITTTVVITVEFFPYPHSITVIFYCPHSNKSIYAVTTVNTVVTMVFTITMVSRHSTTVLSKEIGTHNSSCPATSLVKSSGENQIPVVHSGPPLPP